jgi:hypothetical protein
MDCVHTICNLVIEIGGIVGDQYQKAV